MTLSPKALEAEISKLEAYTELQRETIRFLELAFQSILDGERAKLNATANALKELQHLRPSQ